MQRMNAQWQKDLQRISIKVKEGSREKRCGTVNKEKLKDGKTDCFKDHITNVEPI